MNSFIPYIIYQSHWTLAAENGYTPYHRVAVAPVVEAGQAVTVHYVIVLHLKTIYGIDGIYHEGLGLLQTVIFHKILALKEILGYIEGNLALVVGK